MMMKKYLSVIVGIVLTGHAVSGQAADCSGKDSSNWPTSRNVLEWPFAQNSIWNMPIGCNARYVDARLNPPDDLGVDVDVMVVSNPGDPKVPVYWAGGIEGNTSKFVYGEDTDRCKGTIELDPGSRIEFPRNFVLPSRGKNYSTAITTPDHRYIYQINALARCNADGPVYGLYKNFASCKEDLQGSGIACEGGHGGTGLSSIGGTLRKSDFVGSEPIRHPLKISLAVFQYYLNRGTGNCEARWPATRCDNHGNKYGGAGVEASSNVFANRQGALLAIPPNVSASSLGIQSRPGKKLFDAMQDYGAYTVDGGGTVRDRIRNTLTATQDAMDAFQQQYGFPMDFADNQSTGGATNKAEYSAWMSDVKKIFKSLHVVDDNSPGAPGGAGAAKRRPMAPTFGAGQSNGGGGVQKQEVAPMPPMLINVTSD